MSGAQLAAVLVSGPQATGGAAPLALLRNDADARRDLRRTLALTLAVYAVLAAAQAGLVSPWVFPVAIPLLYVRLSLALHELMHVRNAARVSWFHRLAMIFDTPLGLGYREHRAIHLRHHRYAVTARDPELYQIHGHHWRALGNALISPERAAWTWVRTQGASRALRREAAVRALVFVAVAAFDPFVFLCYWVALRVCIGSASFLFHHVMHSRAGVLGTFRLPQLPRVVRVVARALFGHEPVTIVSEHRTHHQCPGIRARDLAAEPDCLHR
jgi:fatty acid desaturase